MLLKQLAAVCAMMAVFGCLSKVDTVSPATAEIGSVSFRIAIAANSPFRKIAKTAELDITAPDMAPIIKPLRINDSTVYGKVDDIPAGENRTFLAKVFDSAGTECYRGSVTGRIKSDSTTLISLPISRLVGSAIINGTIDEGGDITPGPFAKDSSTVFLADFNDNLRDFVSGEDGQVTGGKFAAGLFGKSLQFDSTLYPKAAYRFPASSRISVKSGSIEALVNTHGTSAGFMHIVDKSWLYGLTVYDGMVAVDFGVVWWYSNYRMPLEKWTYLCGTYDGETIRLYANGTLVDSSAYAPSQGSDSWGLGIGNADDDGFNIPFIGRIDGVRISRRARTGSEVAGNWKSIAGKIAE